MPTLIDPFTATTVRWPPRRQGRVAITGTLAPDSDTLLSFPCKLELRVTFQRELLTAALRSSLWRDRLPTRFFPIVANSIVTALANMAYLYHLDSREFSTLRKRSVTLPLSVPIDEQSTFRYRVTVPQSLFAGDGSKVKQFFRQRGSFTALNWDVLFTIFPPTIQGYLTSPPRGKKAKAWPLADCLPAALFLARHLVIDKPDGDSSLARRLTKVLEKDQNYSDYVSSQGYSATRSAQRRSQQWEIVALVDRAFQGAWEKYRVKPLTQFLDPQDVFTQYLSSKKRASVQQAWGSLTPCVKKQIADLWIKRLLGEPGQAAKDFRLIR